MVSGDLSLVCSYFVNRYLNLFGLLSRGDNEAGTTGIGSREGHQYTPKLLERLAGKRVVQLSACGFHTGCLTDSGNGGELELYTFGEGMRII